MMQKLALAAAALAGTLGCKSLPDIEADVCGNGVWEPDAGEACDGIPERKGWVCRAPGTPAECQYDCTTDRGIRPECPPDFGCAADGVCRADTRTFEPAAVPLSTEACSSLSAVDFDGNGQIEVLSTEPTDALKQARFRLHYFERDGSLQETRIFPRLTTRPVVRDVGGEGRDDLIFSNLRVGMVPGRADREWVPSAFSSYVVPNSGLLMLGVSQDSVGSATAIVAITAIADEEDDEPRPGLYVPDFASGRLQRRSTLPAPLEGLAGVPVAADVFEGADSPCDEILLAFRGDSRLHVFDLCVSSPDPGRPDLLWRDEALARVVALPEGAEVDGPPLSGDVNGDGHLDVVIGAGGLSFVAYGDGLALEPIALPLTVSLEMPGPGTVKQSELHVPTPLSLGDLSGDGVADFVLPEGILSSYTRRSLPGIRYLWSLRNRGAPWTVAQVSDLNGNGLVDAVAATAGVPGLTFASGTGGPYQIEASLGTRGPVRFLTTGDFDGDRVGDLAFVEEAPDAKQVLAVAFGARDTPPAISHQIAELDSIDQLGDHSERGFDHLFVTSNERRGGQAISSFTLFDGNSDRLPFAPYALVTFAQNGNLEDSAAVAVVAGAFSAPVTSSSPGSSDVVALGLRQRGGVWDPWLLPRIGDKEQPLRLTGPLLDGFFPVEVSGELRTLRVAGAAADVDGDGFDEALWLMPDGSASCALLIVDIDAQSGTFAQRGAVRFDEPCPEPQLAVSDLDGSRGVDLLALLGDARRSPRQLRVLWNDGHGAFSSDASLRIADPGGADIASFSAFPDLHKLEPGRRIAFVSAAGLRVAEPSAARQHVGYELIREVQEFERAQAVLVADANDDGVPDIFAADARGLWLFRAALR